MTSDLEGRTETVLMNTMSRKINNISSMEKHDSSYIFAKLHKRIYNSLLFPAEMNTSKNEYILAFGSHNKLHIWLFLCGKLVQWLTWYINSPFDRSLIDRRSDKQTRVSRITPVDLYLVCIDVFPWLKQRTF